ncbi:Co2+/Mg2+ efflux protein ApaG [Brevundimonas sp. LM2]|uniref:Co2+/Mg2+ efflux protein ApaG n=1 Tax=Brevundimonas sp. LM2 TaxID=1938605 RepID=UPI000983BDD3|nr:Co2+/Mg2+ efflux protein ApaG [Brevundimonas sp. LM2]AQR60755.1 Co2+/Mg2+ efflux protein ApaG [Brevundimonas sp. LM2]
MHDSRPYEAETEGVIVRVRPAYLAGQSDPDEGRWVWAYQVEIENRGSQAVQLMARRWIITDGTGHVETVGGPGVVGEQPLIAPGDSYSYASGCPLPTPSGLMAGAYTMTDAAGRSFEATIPTFSLDVPEGRVLN